MFNEITTDKNDFKVTDKREVRQPLDAWSYDARQPEKPLPEFDLNQHNKEKREKHSFLFWGGEIADLKPIK